MNKQIDPVALDQGVCRGAIDQVLEARLFKALCDSTRLTILAELAQGGGPRTVGDIARGLPVDVSVVSRHLTMLRQAGVLEAARHGKEVRYTVRYEGLADTFRAIAGAIDACCPSGRGKTEEPIMSEQSKAHEQIHHEVAGFYAKALSRNSCCPSGGCGADTGAAELSGYSASDTDALPDDAVANSFGCGNPVAFSGVQPGDVVVDLGSGAGIDVIMAGHKVGPEGHVIGVDMTGDMIARARANIADAGLANAEIREGLIEHMPVDDGAADWVISNCVINLSPDKPAVFGEIARVLKPGGQMLVSDIVVEDLPAWVRADKALYSACVAGAVSEAAYLAGLGEAGLVDIEIRDRLDYDSGQIAAMYRDEAGGDGASDDVVERAAQEATGKVASISVYARRPVADV